MNRFPILLLLAGCTMGGSVEDPGHDLQCKDTRDDEQFLIRLDTITNVRLGIGTDSCFDAEDENGAVRTHCSSHERWIKCAPVIRGRTDV